MAVSSIVGQESVVRKTQFPRLVIPLAVVLTALFNLGMNLVVVFVFILACGRRPDVDVAAVPGRARAAVRAHHGGVDDRRRRSTRASATSAIIWSVAVDRAVLRDAGAVPDRASCRGTLRDVLALNPLAPIFELARKWVIDPTAPGAGRRRGRRGVAADPGGALRRDLRVRGLGLQPRGAADRRGALNTHERCTTKLTGATTRIAATCARTSGRPATSTKNVSSTTPSATAEANTIR